MKKREASQHMLVEAWMRNFLKTHDSCVIELKHSRDKDSIAFDALEEHQETALDTAMNEMVVWKIDDVGYRQKPFDLIGVAHSWSFVAVRYPEFIAIISLNEWRKARDKAGRKSLTSEYARSISYDVIVV